MLTEAQAIAKVRIKCGAENEPCLSEAEIKFCLAENARASVWVAETAYAVGAKVVPSLGNGRVYKCIQPGISGATQPTTWARATQPGHCLNDGTAIWMDDGPAMPELWDINAAIGAAWRLKAAKDSALIAIQDKDTEIDLTTRRDFALRQAARCIGTWVV